MDITCIGCLHGYYPKLDGGDLLIVTGDLTARDTPREHLEFVEWCRYLPYRKIIVIAGNHDNFLQRLKSKYFGMPVYHDHCEYLCDSGTEFEGLKIYGSPHSLLFPGINPHCTAFTGTEEELAEKFTLIPDDVDILVTHSPPFGILDSVDKGKRLTGSLSLRNRMMEIKPKLSVFSHIHEWGGKMLDTTLTKCVNCSHVNERYQPVNKLIRIIL